jgi:signal transduction histidine kinase
MGEVVLLNQLEINSPVSVERLQNILVKQASIENMRFAVIDNDGIVLADSGIGIDPPLPYLGSPPVITGLDPISFNTFRDDKRTSWLYILRPLDESSYILAATKRRELNLDIIMRDEIIGPIFRGSLAALFLSFVLGLFMSAWIGNPLKRLAEGTRQIGVGNYPILPKDGPQEVQELADSFNLMSKRVRQSEESQRDFLTNVSHELKTPLTSIQGFAQSILDGAASSTQELNQAANVIYTEAARMHRLVMDLLTLSKLEDGSANMRIIPVDISILLNEICEKLSPQIKKSGLTMIKNIEPGLIVLGDDDRLAQVFMNLLDNAVKFTPPGGTIKLVLKDEKDSILVSIIDSGTGIPLEEEHRIFERFYQIEKSRKGGAPRGVGLGLAIARQIILAHKGEIWVTSHPQNGSTFFVRLPSKSKQSEKISKR